MCGNLVYIDLVTRDIPSKTHAFEKRYFKAAKGHILRCSSKDHVIKSQKYQEELKVCSVIGRIKDS